MKIIWNRVTWVSKIVAVCLFITVAVVSFCAGEKYGEKRGFIYWAESRLALRGEEEKEVDFYADTKKWAYRSEGGVEFGYPPDLEGENLLLSSFSDGRWSAASPVSGNKIFRIRVPKIFDRQTNFSGADLTIGYSAEKEAVDNCLSPDRSGSAMKKEIDGRVYSVISASEEGSGDHRFTKIYRTLADGRCYSIEYEIRSENVKDFPEAYDLRLVHKERIADLLDDIVGTVKIKKTP